MWTSELLSLAALRWLGVLACALPLAAVAHVLFAVPALEAPSYGVRGRHRAEARAHEAFRCLEPVLRMIGAWVARLPLASVRARLGALVHVAGDVAGLCADELVACSLLGAVLLPAVWLAIGGAASCLPLALLIGAALAPLHVRQLGSDRAKSLERSLPNAMDLCALCMGAGSDFPAAVRFVALDLGQEHAVCREELFALLEELRLGRTRVEALTALGHRTLSRAVREFVAAVCQSEQKGTPLVEVLAIQAATLRQRRSVRAEELAAQAGVKMMIPLVLMMASLLLIVFGPFVVRGMGL